VAGLEHPQWLDSLEFVSCFYSFGFELLAIPQSVSVTIAVMVGGFFGFYCLFTQCPLSVNGHHSPD
jgi:hypothetical protein